jgi:hypoxanthine phosphoribosyltransferase
MKKELTFGETMIEASDIQKRVAELGAQISADYAGQTILTICVLKGACIFMSDLLKNITTDTNIDFMAVSSYGASTSSSGVVRILKDLDSSIENKHVLIVEDIIDSGLTLHYLRDYLLARKPRSLKICTLLDKPERREADIAADYVGFVIENKFIVGYGLDYQEKYRNLPYITCLVENK